MIDFRYHLVSIIAVFLALAVGIVLGAGPLDQPIDVAVRDRAAGLAKDKEALRSQNTELTARVAFDDSLINEAAPALTSGRLTGTDVVVVALPGVTGDLVTGTHDALETAGATVPGMVSLTSDWTDPTRSTALAATLDAVAPKQAQLPGNDGKDVAARAAAALAAAVITPEPPADGKSATAAERLLKGLRDASFLRLRDKPWQGASIAIVLAPPPPADEATRKPDQVAKDDAARAALLQVPRRMSGDALGLVVAGPRGSAAAGGVVAAVRTGEQRTSVSTVDDLGTPAGRVAIVLAVLAEREDETGHYGDGPNADSPLPSIAGVTAP
jgi:hypothetical protein